MYTERSLQSSFSLAKKGRQEYSVLLQLTWRGLRKKTEHVTNGIGVCKEQTDPGEVGACKSSEVAPYILAVPRFLADKEKSEKKARAVHKAKLCSSAKGLARREGRRVSAPEPSSSSPCLHQLLTH